MRALDSVQLKLQVKASDIYMESVNRVMQLVKSYDFVTVNLFVVLS